MTSKGTCTGRMLTPNEMAAFAAELDALRRDTMASVGEREADYVHRVQAFVRYSEIGGRGC
jgi:hypothetical protein